VTIQSSSDLTPSLSKVLLSVFGKEHGEGGFLGKRSGEIVGGGEGFDLPLQIRRAGEDV
jgi:hypothetical protein